MLPGDAGLLPENDASFGIEGVGPDPQKEGGPVLLVVKRQELDQLRRLIDADGKDAGRQRIQGPRMARLPDPERSLDLLHHIPGCRPRRLIDDDDPVHASAADILIASSTRRRMSGSSPVIRQAAALI